MIILVVLSLSFSFCMSFALLQCLQQQHYYQEQNNKNDNNNGGTNEIIFTPLITSTFCLNFFSIVACMLGYYSYNVVVDDGVKIIKRLCQFIIYCIVPFMLVMNYAFFYQQDNITLFFHSTLKIRYQQRLLQHVNGNTTNNHKINTTCVGWHAMLSIIVNFYFFLFSCIMNYASNSNAHYNSSKKTKSTTCTTSSNVKKENNMVTCLQYYVMWDLLLCSWVNLV